MATTKSLISILRTALVIVLAVCLWNAATAKADSFGGDHGHFDFPTGGQHGWSSGGPQPAALSGDLAAAIR